MFSQAHFTIVVGDMHFTCVVRTVLWCFSNPHDRSVIVVPLSPDVVRFWFPHRGDDAVGGRDAYGDRGCGVHDSARLAGHGRGAAMTSQLQPPDLRRPHGRDELDPVVEGAQHGLSAPLALAIWERVCADATDGTDRLDI